jgi:hypothetical protein
MCTCIRATDVHKVHEKTQARAQTYKCRHAFTTNSTNTTITHALEHLCMQQEWEKFQISDPILAEDYLKAGEFYFEPDMDDGLPSPPSPPFPPVPPISPSHTLSPLILSPLRPPSPSHLSQKNWRRLHGRISRQRKKERDRRIGRN